MAIRDGVFPVFIKETASSIAVRDGVFPVYHTFTSGTATSTVQGHEFNVQVPSAGTDIVGAQFTVSLGATIEQGHYFNVAMTDEVTQGHYFFVPGNSAALMGHEFAVALSGSRAIGHLFSVGVDATNAQGYYFDVIATAENTQGSYFTVGIVGVASSQGHSFRVPRRSRKVSGLESSDVETINNDITIIPEEPEASVQYIPGTADQQEEITPEAKLEQRIDKFQKWLEAAKEIEVVLDKRLKSRAVKAKPNDIQLRQAIRRTFNVDSDVVTFEMFKEALKIRSQILEAERKKEYEPADPDDSV
jgi:hypothetical protein